MDCSMCGEEIPPPRLEAIPITLTCNADCARERALWRRRQAARRQYERRKAARAAERAAAAAAAHDLRCVRRFLCCREGRCPRRIAGMAARRPCGDVRLRALPDCAGHR